MSETRLFSAIGALTELASLTHDLGKASNAFQIRLHRSIRGENAPFDTVRHDLLSLLILQPLITMSNEDIRQLCRSKESARNFFECDSLNHLSSVQSYYEKTVRSALDSDISRLTLESFNIEGFDLAGFRSSPMIYSLLWLVLTHHKLPISIYEPAKKHPRIPSKSKNEHFFPRLSGYINAFDFDSLEDYFTVGNSSLGKPWANDAWLDRFRSLLSKLIEYNDMQVDLSINNPLISSMLYIARPNLIMADHVASFSKEESTKPNCIIANTIEKNGRYYSADPLDIHLIKTADNAKKYHQSLFRPKNRKISLPRLKLSETTKLGGNGAGDRYVWQNHLAKASDTVKPADGMIALITSSTGTGKTRGCIKLLREASGRNGLRAMLGLGMRSLADQGYNDYKDSDGYIDLPKDRVGRIISSFYPIDSLSEVNPGTAYTEAGSSLLFDGDGNKFDDSSLADLLDSGKVHPMMANAVTSMTIDNIIGAIDLHRSTDCYLIPHLLQTDMIIDEIDNLSSEDLNFIIMLVYLLGLYGRKVVLASATLNPQLSEAAVDAYRRGFDNHQSIYGKRNARLLICGSDAPYIQSHSLNELSGSTALSNYVSQMPKLLENKRHIPSVMKDSGSLQSAFRDIHYASHALSSLHNTYVESHDIHWSAGFVRLNLVEDAQLFARMISEQIDDSDCYVEVICYHSKTTQMDRYFTEHHLNNLMKRDINGKTKCKDRDVLDAYHRFLDRAKASGKKTASLIVATTSIIEVGRDHDYDWCIIEPSSLSSWLQSLGRILRHRIKDEVDPNNPNALLLDQPLSVYNPARRNLWSYPGIETPSPLFQRNADATPEYSVTFSPMTYHRQRIESIGIEVDDNNEGLVVNSEQLLGEALVNPNNRLTLRTPIKLSSLPEQSQALLKYAEHLISGYNPMGRPDLESLNVGNITSIDRNLLQTKLGKKYKFRGDQETVQLMSKDIDGNYDRGWWMADMMDSGLGQSFHYEIEDLKIDNEEYFYLSNDKVHRSNIIQSYQFRFGSLENEEISGLLFSVSLRSNEASKVTHFNWLLGCLKI